MSLDQSLIGISEGLPKKHQTELRFSAHASERSCAHQLLVQSLNINLNAFGREAITFVSIDLAKE